MDKIEKIRRKVKELQDEFISIQPKDCSLELIKSYAGYAYLDKVLSFLDTLPEEPDKSLEEAAEEYIKKGRYLPEAWVVRPAFVAGAEWQARQLLQGSPMPEDTVLFNKGVAEGRRLEREDMLKDAVEGKIYGYDDGSYELVASWLDLPKGGIYKDGDKVRIVVLKEEE